MILYKHNDVHSVNLENTTDLYIEADNNLAIEFINGKIKYYVLTKIEVETIKNFGLNYFIHENTLKI